MSSLPNQTSAAFRKRNPHLFPSEQSGAAKEVIRTEDKTNGGHIGNSRRKPPEGVAVTTGERASEQNTRQFIIHTDPVPAPRMTRADRWRGLPGSKVSRRPCVQRYFEYRYTLQRAIGDLPIVPDELHAVFHFAMPESWSKTRRQQMDGQPHRQRPDGDNCVKAVQDSLFLEDGAVWKGSYEKWWSVHARVELQMRWHSP